MADFINTVVCLDCPKKINFFSYLNEKEIKFINEHRHEVKFNPGETILKQGGALTHAICLNSGMGKIYVEGIYKKNVLLKIIKPTELLAGPGMFTDFRHHYTVVALTDAIACFIEMDAFKHIVKSNSKFAIGLISWINTQGIKNFERIINLTQKQMHGRIADVLIYLSEMIYNNNFFSANISRQDIADFAAMSKESAIRIIKEFKDAGIIIVNGNRFEILNLKALKSISKTG